MFFRIKKKRFFSQAGNPGDHIKPVFFFHGDSVPRAGVIFGAIQASIKPIFRKMTFFKIDLFIKIYILSTNGRYSDLEAEKLVYKLSWRVPGGA